MRSWRQWAHRPRLPLLWCRLVGSDCPRISQKLPSSCFRRVPSGSPGRTSTSTAVSVSKHLFDLTRFRLAVVGEPEFLCGRGDDQLLDSPCNEGRYQLLLTCRPLS